MSNVDNLNRMHPAAHFANLGDKLNAIITLINQLKTSVANQKTALGNLILARSSLAIGIGNTGVAHGNVAFSISGIGYYKAAATDNIDMTGMDIAVNTRRMCRVYMKNDGTTTIALGTAVASGSSASPPTVTSSWACLGTVEVLCTTIAYTGGTSALNHASYTTTYTDFTYRPGDIADSSAAAVGTL